MTIKVSLDVMPRAGRVMFIAFFEERPHLMVKWHDLHGAVGLLIHTHGKEIGIGIDLDVPPNIPDPGM